MAPTSRGSGASAIQFVWAGVFSVAAIVAGLSMRMFPLNLPLRIGVVLATAAPGVAWIVTLVRDVRRMDEMQQRIYVEAVAVAFAGTFLLTLMYPTLRRAGFIPDLTPVSVAVTMVVLGLASYLIAKRRY